MKISPARRRGGPQLCWEERSSSRSIQVAKQNRSTGAPQGGVGLCFARPAPEHTIWQSEVKRKGQAGVKDTKCFVPDMSIEAPLQIFISLTQLHKGFA